MKLKSKFIIVLLCFLLTFPTIENMSYDSILVVEAHSGRTDSSGGHKDNKNKSGLGSYHYHCGGYSAHLHSNGVCPYSSKTNPTSNNTKKSSTPNNISSSKNSNKATIKAVQKELNSKGYDCGTPDGIMGNKTKRAIKKFQKDNGLTVDGKIGKQVKSELNIS